MSFTSTLDRNGCHHRQDFFLIQNKRRHIRLTALKIHFDRCAVDPGEESFLLTSIGRVLERTPTRADVVGRFAGLRPLLAGDGETADLSRRHAVVVHDGISTVVGGKLTTARRMAQDGLDRIAAAGAGACVTHRIRLAGWDRPSGDLAAQLRFAATHELALTVDDLLDRRTRLGFVPQWREDALAAADEALADAAAASG